MWNVEGVCPSYLVPRPSGQQNGSNVFSPNGLFGYGNWFGGFLFMKQSKYNFVFDHKGKKYAFNAVTCALAEVNSDFFNLLNNVVSVKDETINKKNKKLLSLMKNYLCSN